MASWKWGTSSQQQGLGMSKELCSSLKEAFSFVGKMVKYTVQGGIAFCRLLLRNLKET